MRFNQMRGETSEQEQAKVLEDTLTNAKATVIREKQKADAAEARAALARSELKATGAAEHAIKEAQEMDVAGNLVGLAECGVWPNSSKTHWQ